MNLSYNFYAGFEGEPRMTIKHFDVDGNLHCSLAMWIGYFDSIMMQIKPNNHGHWEGIILFYHMHTAWYEESNWSLTTNDVELFLRQLEMIDISQFNFEERSVLDALVTVLRNSVKMNGKIRFDYF